MTSGKYGDNNAIKYEWSEDMSVILDKMRINCIALSDHHKYRYTFYKDKMILFRFPIILLSGINTFVSVGLIGITDQINISITSSLISLVCGIITSLELYLNYQKRMESELMSHKEYYRLSVEIFKVISLDIENRKVDGKAFLEEKFSTYEKLLQSSNVVEASYVIPTLTPKDPIIIDMLESNNHLDTDLENQFAVSRFIPTVQSITQPQLYKLKQKNKEVEKRMRQSNVMGLSKQIHLESKCKDDYHEELHEYKSEIDKYKKEIESLKQSMLPINIENSKKKLFVRRTPQPDNSNDNKPDVLSSLDKKVYSQEENNAMIKIKRFIQNKQKIRNKY